MVQNNEPLLLHLTLHTKGNSKSIINLHEKLNKALKHLDENMEILSSCFDNYFLI